MFDPDDYIPDRNRMAALAGNADPYEVAWQESHCGKSLSEAIEAVRQSLHSSYDVASSLVWAEITAQTPRLP